MPDPALQEAIALAKQGKRKEAQAIASRLIKSDPNNADAWIVMAQLVDDDAKKIQCWEQVLRIRPGDERAQQFLTRLRPTADVFDPFFTEPQPPLTKTSTPPSKARRLPAGIIAATILFCIGIAAALILLFALPAARREVADTTPTTVTAKPADVVPASISNTPKITQEHDQPTVTQIPSRTPRATYTEGPTRTPSSTATLRPTYTLTPTATPPITKQIGPIFDTLRDEEYTIAMTLNSWRMTDKVEFYDAKAGYTFLITDITVQNKGPGSALSIAVHLFEVLDGDGVVRDYAGATFSLDCQLESVDLQSGGSISGCVVFEVPDSGHLELIFAPYQYDTIEAGRYISFVIRN